MRPLLLPKTVAIAFGPVGALLVCAASAGALSSVVGVFDLVAASCAAGAHAGAVVALFVVLNFAVSVAAPAVCGAVDFVATGAAAVEPAAEIFALGAAVFSIPGVVAFLNPEAAAVSSAAEAAVAAPSAVPVSVVSVVVAAEAAAVSVAAPAAFSVAELAACSFPGVAAAVAAVAASSVVESAAACAAARPFGVAVLLEHVPRGILLAFYADGSPGHAAVFPLVALGFVCDPEAASA